MVIHEGTRGGSRKLLNDDGELWLDVSALFFIRGRLEDSRLGPETVAVQVDRATCVTGQTLV